MSWLYSLTIYPLELVYKYIYTFCASLTGSYGIGLVALSVCTVVIFTPLKRMASSAQNKEWELQDILQPQIQKISSECSGAERHERIAKLYRRYGYHPVMAIRSAFGVALQVPFLMAAYYMISGLTALQGHSFLFIKDLSQPDGLLSGVNLLPIVMTLVNFAAAFTSKDMRCKDRLQAMVVALLFLWLLYGAPSALLFYWTCNNVIYLMQNLVGMFFTYHDFTLKILNSHQPIAHEKTLPQSPIQETRLPTRYSIFSTLSLIAVALEPCLFMYFHNAGEANFIDIVPVSGYFLLGVFTLTTLLYFPFKKNTVKAVFIANVAMLFFLNYAAIEKVVDKVFPSLYYWHIVYIAVIGLVILTVITHRHVASSFIMKINLILLLIFSGSIIIHAFLATSTIYRKLTEEVDKTTLQVTIDISKNNDMPNVYLLIFDEYGGYECLKKYCNYDNSSFYKSLESLGFNTSPLSYNLSGNTTTEVPNMLNMAFINSPAMLESHKVKNLINPMIYQLASQYNYNLNIADKWNFLDSEHCQYKYIPEQFKIEGTAEDFIIKKTLYYPFYGVARSDEIQSLKNQFDYISHSSEIQKTNLFTISYFCCPHLPWFVDENGNSISSTDRSNWKNPNVYLGQLKYINKLIYKSVSSIIDKDKKSIIIVLSDHGFRLPTHLEAWYKIKDHGYDRKYQTNTLCAVYYQGKLLNVTNLCAVDTIRTVINELLKTKFTIPTPKDQKHLDLN